MKKILTKRILYALFIAIRVHGTSRRRGDGKPYIIHPIAVFKILRRWGTDEDTQIAGILHDVLEDAPEHKKNKYRTKIQKYFGEKVLEIVEGVTEQDKSLPWKERKKLYLEHLKVSSKESAIVSCADLTHNLSALVQAYKKQGEEVWTRFNAIKQWKVWFIDQRSNILREKLPEKYTEELTENLKDLNALLSKPMPPEYLGPQIQGANGCQMFNTDPLYINLWNHCMLTERELEEGMLFE
jgi:(p)ppGpp synthase/HD superfamily hydrolase